MFYNNVGLVSLVKAQVDFFSSILRSFICEFNYTCFHAYLLFMWWRKKGTFNFLFYTIFPVFPYV